MTDKIDYPTVSYKLESALRTDFETWLDAYVHGWNDKIPNTIKGYLQTHPREAIEHIGSFSEAEIDAMVSELGTTPSDEDCLSWVRSVNQRRTNTTT